MKSLKSLSVLSALALATCLATPVLADDGCGWIAVAYCSKSKSSADRFERNNPSWGFVASTNQIDGFRRNYYCLVNGPYLSKSEANATARRARQSFASDAYIKRGCMEEGL